MGNSKLWFGEMKKWGNVEMGECKNGFGWMGRGLLLK
jgi:hypothetical protein